MMCRLSALALALFLVGCATLPEDLPQGVPSKALAPQPGGPLAAAEASLQARLDPDQSGFLLLDANAESLHWRLALIDSATHSLDLQYYVWWGDESGTLIMKHVVLAADRGVRVRLVVDDLTTMLADSTKVEIRDAAAAVIDAHPNIEVRLFNPWRARGIAGRILESMLHLERVNQRMHNKMMIADNRAVIIGGRNLGNEYFGLAPDYGFRDLDTLGIGPVARQASEVFDRFWNSELVVPAGYLDFESTGEDLEEAFSVITRRLETVDRLSDFPLDRQDWHHLLAKLPTVVAVGSSRVHTDRLDEDGVTHVMPAAIRELLEGAKREVIIANAYIIPDAPAIDWLAAEIKRGIRYRIITNSLASHDVPAVHAHYKLWRRDLLRAGVELYEMRPDAAVLPLLVNTPPVEAEFMGLHSKVMVIDGERVFIGSMNLDPRSWRINSEMGVVVESVGLASALQTTLVRDMAPENAWQVTLASDGILHWVAGDEDLTWQPARHFWQRVEDIIFMAFPRSLY